MSADLGMVIVDLRGVGDFITAPAGLGQSVCVLAMAS